ncbi:MAG TPA: hypothetical protein VFJ74_14295 [Gemmatimonadaceae bacterium]|nr:hypothetical protein [Gemmatimonadaceae bacterium]
MPSDRQPYVKPTVHQLHYMADQHVSLAAGCKTNGAASGPTTANCKTTANTPCVNSGS